MKSIKTPLARILLGTILVLASLAIRHLDRESAAVVAGICKVPGIVCDVSTFGLTTLGLGGVWTFLLTLGIFYLVIYEWIASYIKEVVQGIVTTTTDIHRITILQICSHRFTRAELKLLLVSIFGNPSGHNEPEGELLGSFVADLLLYVRPGRVSRRQCNVNIRISEPTAPNLRSKFYDWNQNTTYELVGTKTGGVVSKLQNFGNIPCTVDDIESMLDGFNYRVRVGNVELSFADARRHIHVDELVRGGECKHQNFRTKFDNGMLSIRFDYTINVKDTNVSVAVDERSLILRDDKEFVHTIVETTRAFFMRFEVPVGCSIVSCHTSLSGYEHFLVQPQVPGPMTIDADRRTAEITSTSWILPGIAAAVTWR